MNNRNKIEILKRYILFTIGLFFLALGIAITKHAELGVSPVSSVANVMSCKFTNLSMGTWLIIWSCILILGQILILRRKFQLIQLLQVPLAFLLGWFTDFGMWMVSSIPNDEYIVRLLMVVIGIVILGFGIALTIIADVILNSGEAFVKCIADTIKKEFGNVKIIFDIANVSLSIILSLIFFDFAIVGTREGTIITAFCTGFFVKVFTKLLREPVEKILLSKNKK